MAIEPTVNGSGAATVSLMLSGLVAASPESPASRDVEGRRLPARCYDSTSSIVGGTGETTGNGRGGDFSSAYFSYQTTVAAPRHSRTPTSTKVSSSKSSQLAPKDP